MTTENDTSTSVGMGNHAATDVSPNDSAMTIYEIGYLLLPTLSEEDVPREVTAIKDSLEKESYIPIAEAFPKFRQLAYPIHKRISGAYQTFTNAYFGWIKFEVSPSALKHIEETLKRNAKVLRFLLIKTVREHTMIVPRPPRQEFKIERKGAPKDAPAPAPISESELDKSLEKLIAE